MRARPIVVLSISMLLVVGALGGVVQYVRTSGPAPHRITVQGVALRLVGETPFVHAHLDDADPSVLIVEAGEGYPGPPRACRTWVTAQLLHEDAHSVRVATYTYRTAGRTPGACTLEGYLPKPLRVQLRAPFDGRVLYDGDRSDPVPVLDPRSLLVPGWLPAGYSRTGRLSFDNAPADPTGYALRTYPGQHGSAIELYEGKPRHAPGPTGDALSDIEVVRSRLTVRGHPGVVHLARNFDDVVCLRWAERADLVVSVCSRGNPAPLTDVQLRQVAESLASPAK